LSKRIDLKGNLRLLSRPRVTIVGSRKPLPYTKEVTLNLARAFAKKGYVVVSGGALGVDALAHQGAGADNTIAVLPGGIDIYYPKTNSSLLKEIAQKGLLISQFEKGFSPRRWSFVARNETMVELGEFLIITQADLKSGSLTSARFALKKGKKIFVIPHRLGESEGTAKLVREGKAQFIWDIEEFVGVKEEKDDPFISFIKQTPIYEEAVRKFGDRIYEAELEGSIEIRDGRVFWKGES